jgi:hypothetical protein
MRFTDLSTSRQISSAPMQDEEHVVMLYCPEQGGWHTENSLAAEPRGECRPGAYTLAAGAS